MCEFKLAQHNEWHSVAKGTRADIQTSTHFKLVNKSCTNLIPRSVSSHYDVCRCDGQRIHQLPHVELVDVLDVGHAVQLRQDSARKKKTYIDKSVINQMSKSIV